MATREPDPWKVENFGSDNQRVRMELIDSPRWDQLIRLTHDGNTVEIGVDDEVGEVLQEELPEWAKEVAWRVGVPEVR